MHLIINTEIKSPRLLEISAYLDSKRRLGHKLRRSDLDPITEIPRLSGNLALLEKIEEGCFRVRLCGSVVADILGNDITGLVLDTRPPNATTPWDKSLNDVFLTDRLMNGVGTPMGPSRSHVVFEWVSQLLEVEPGEPPMVLAALDHRPVT